MNTYASDWLVVSNPHSGRGKSVGKIRDIETELHSRSATFQLIEENELDTVLEKLEKILIHSPPIRGLMVLGGDGTLHHVANAVLKIRPQTPIAVIPLGTGNDFALQCGFKGLTPIELIDIFISKRPEKIDVISVNGVHCLQVLSTGFDARVSARSFSLPTILGNLRYVLGLLIEIFTLHPIDYSLVINGEVRHLAALMISCANGQNYGGGMKISPNSHHQDGIFELVIIHPVKRFELLKVFPRIFRGSHLRHPAVEIIQVREMELSAPTIAQGDGEPIAQEGISLKITQNHIFAWKC